MSQPRISQANIWENYKKDIFHIIQVALMILRSRQNLPIIEDHPKKHSLNRELYKCFVEAARRENLPFLSPVREGKHPPFEGDISPTEHESKIPDFYWHIVDDSAAEDSCERRFILECKRLGAPPSPSWTLNENYVQNGIHRFVKPPHEYGKGDDSGGMVGYVQNMELSQILEEVNAAARNSSERIPDLALSPIGWVESGVSELGHELSRSFPISPYFLHHFWIDLRNS